LLLLWAGVVTLAAKAFPAWRKSKCGRRSAARIQADFASGQLAEWFDLEKPGCRSLLSKFVGIIETDQCGFISTEAKDKELHFRRIWVEAALLVGQKDR
jgi:hypothetical protein